jgi:hypothetical protein
MGRVPLIPAGKLLDGLRAKCIGAGYATLNKLDNPLCHQSGRLVVGVVQTHSCTGPLKGDSHYGDDFWLKCSTREKWADRHDSTPNTL